MGSLTIDDIRTKLGLKPKPAVYSQRGDGQTTEMLLEALEVAGKGNIAHIICNDFHFCGHLKSITTDYAKTLKIDAKLIQFVPASTAYQHMAGLHDFTLFIDHYVYESGSFDDYELQRLVDYARSQPFSD